MQSENAASSETDNGTASEIVSESADGNSQSALDSTSVAESLSVSAMLSESISVSLSLSASLSTSESISMSESIAASESARMEEESIADEDVPLAVYNDEDEEVIGEEETPLASAEKSFMEKMKEKAAWGILPAVAAGAAAKTLYDKKRKKGLFAAAKDKDKKDDQNDRD